MHNRVRTVQTTCDNFDGDTASTASVTTTVSLPIIMDEQPLSLSLTNSNDRPLNFSQDTIEHFCGPEDLPSHARHHDREMQPMDTLVTAGGS